MTPVWRHKPFGGSSPNSLVSAHWWLSPTPPLFHCNDEEDDEDTIIFDGCSLITGAARWIGTRRQGQGCTTSSRHGRIAKPRAWRSVEEIYTGMGPRYFWQVYWMQYESFWRLHKKLKMGIESARLESRWYCKKGGGKGGNFLLPPVMNDPITTSVLLTCVLRFFAGGSPCDIMDKYGISYSEVMESAWYVVDAINKL